MELRHLRYFVAVAEEMNFTRAAERLHIAQPALTRLIHDLEEELHVLLFDRRRRQIVLTAAGQGFLEQAYLVLANVEKAVHIARKIDQGELGRLEIGFTGAAIYSVLPEIVHRYEERFPDVEVTLHDLPMREQLNALCQHRLDVGFALVPLHVEHIAYEQLLDCPMIAVLPRAHALTDQPRIPLSALAEDPWIWFPRSLNPRYHDQNLLFCQQAGFEPRIVQQTNHPHVMASLVAAGLGVAMMSAWVQNFQREGVIYRPFQESSWRVELQMMWREKETSPLIQAFIAAAREVSQSFAGRAEMTT